MKWNSKKAVIDLDSINNLALGVMNR